MGVVAWARERFANNSTSVKLISAARTVTPLGPIRDYGIYYRAYQDNVVWRACVDEVSTSFAEAPLVAKRRKADKSELLPSNHPLAFMLDHPYPEEKLSGFAFRQRLAVDMRNCGNSAIRIVRSKSGMPVRLWPLRMDLLKIKCKGDGSISHYRYGESTSWRASSLVDGTSPDIPSRADALDLPPGDVIHIKNPDPLDDFWGMPCGGRREIAMDDKASDFVRSYWENNAIPSLLIKLKQKVVPKNVREGIENAFAERYGPGGMRIMAHDADVEIEKISQDLAELKMADIFGHTEARICAAHQVPAIVIGVRIGLMYGTYANYKSARRSFWEETMSPFFQLTNSALTGSLALEFGDDICIESDTAKVEALQESQEDKRRFALDAWNAGAITLNEFNRRNGLSPVPDGDRYKGAQQQPMAPSRKSADPERVPNTPPSSPDQAPVESAA